MTLVTGEITEIAVGALTCRAKIRVGGAYTYASLDLVPDARVGDVVLVEAGVAIANVEKNHGEENPHVPGNSR